MNKKHVAPIAIILTLIVMVKVFAYTLPEVTTSPRKDTIKTTIRLVEVQEKASQITPPEDILAFAEEALPIGDKKVDLKLKKVLASFSFKKLQTNTLHKKAKAWFPIIEPILHAYGIPNDFKYMPLVESGLRGGTSPKGAAGFWQFMPGTARSYGLKVNGHIDERKNLRKSTIAACKYLKDLYRVFNSWTLAAAAYNVGDTRMTRQINRQKQDNYFKMKLNRETGKYVYKLVSVKEIMENPKRNGYAKQKPLLAYAGDESGGLE